MDTQWFEASVFGEDVISLTDKWTVSVELRYDKVDLGDMFSNTWQNIHNLDPNNPFKTAHKTPEPIDGHVSPSVATAYNLDKDTII